jgi:flagellar biosynthesis/type III secretory pathway chaperone
LELKLDDREKEFFNSIDRLKKSNQFEKLLVEENFRQVLRMIFVNCSSSVFPKELKEKDQRIAEYEKELNILLTDFQNLKN